MKIQKRIRNNKEWWVVNFKGGRLGLPSRELAEKAIEAYKKTGSVLGVTYNVEVASF